MRLALSLAPSLLLALALGCGGTAASGGAGGTGGAGGGAGGTGGGAGGAETGDFIAGGARPVEVKVPASYDPAVPAPLVILLHGYSASGFLQDIYFGMSAVAETKGVIFANPDGNTDAMGNKFWNATDACCDFDGTGGDDAGYLRGLVEEIQAKRSVDPKRIYFVGHSNGAFMSYRMACDASDLVAAIAGLAGATFANDASCQATEPVSVAHLHGSVDATVLYGGSSIGLGAYPGAEESVALWSARGGCSGALADTGATKDLDLDVPGAETHVLATDGCPAGLSYELWRMEGSGHIPGVPQPEFAEAVLDWLLAHPKP